MRRLTPFAVVAIAVVIFALMFKSAEAAGPAPSIALSPAADGRWRAAYTFDAPVAAMRFARVPNGWRAEHWTPLDAAFEFHHENGAAIVRRKDGAPFSAVAFNILARYLPLPKDYAPFSPFSDGGLLIHTGQFHACAGVQECEDGLAWTIEVDVPRRTHIVALSELRKGKAQFVSKDDGSNIYLGRAKPIPSTHFIAIIDEKLPGDVRDGLYLLLPALMDYFAERLGPLDAKPMLFASLDPNAPEGSDFSNQGGTLPNEIFIHLYGKKWASEAAAQAGGFLPWFFAHEAGHLFQRSELSGGWVMEQSWIHEGGADAFAALTIAEIGEVSPDYVSGRIRKALDSCAKGLGELGAPLNEAGAAGAFELYYTCGLLIHLAINAEVNRASEDDKDLFDVWADYLARLKAGAAADQDSFLAAAIEHGAVKAAAFARSLATEKHADVTAFIHAEMAEAGIVTAE